MTCIENNPFDCSCKGTPSIHEISAPESPNPLKAFSNEFSRENLLKVRHGRCASSQNGASWTKGRKHLFRHTVKRMSEVGEDYRNLFSDNNKELAKSSGHVRKDIGKQDLNGNGNRNTNLTPI